MLFRIEMKNNKTAIKELSIIFEHMGNVSLRPPKKTFKRAEAK